MKKKPTSKGTQRVTNNRMTIDGRAHFPSPPGITTLYKEDMITIALDGFHPGASIDNVTIYKNKAGTKGEKIYSWTRGSGPKGDDTIYRVAADPVNAQVVTITDVDDSKTKATYWFSVSGTRGNSFWGVDPELINHPGRPPG